MPMLETPLDILAHEASLDAARGFIDWRRSLKKPLTTRAAGLVSKSLREITACGGDADEALDMTQERGWLTIKPAWYWNAKRQEAPQLKAINGGRYDQSHHDFTEQRGDPALEHIARLAGVGQTSGDGRF